MCIVGLGLMGGSLALALRRARRQAEDAAWQAARLPTRIIAVGRNSRTLAAAQSAGAIDGWTTDLAEGVAGAEVVILGAPVRTIMRLLPEIGRCADVGTLVLDLGSTKVKICATMADLPAHVEPIGGHPMCGKETAGFAAAEATLFEDRPFVLCPLARTSQMSIERATALARAIGARPLVLDPARHDRAVATISHLPYVIAVALVRAADDGGDATTWSLAASGFRDTTRVAASDVEMMLDILLTNRPAIVERLDDFSSQLATLRAVLTESDESGLRVLLAAAQQRRASLRFQPR
jgi:prephenate dehydrogenase